MEFRPQKNKLQDILDHRLLNVAPSVQAFLPPVLFQQDTSWDFFPYETYVVVAFAPHEQLLRAAESVEKGHAPFPSLITTSHSFSAALKLDDSRNYVLERVEIQNGYAVRLGRDSSIVFVGHVQTIDVPGMTKSSYTIPLAYALSFGHIITPTTFYEYFENLIAYSVSYWRSEHVPA